MHFDLGCFRVNQTYVQDDMCISSIVRAHVKTKIKPQTAVICKCKVRNHSNLPESDFYKISLLDVGFLN